MDQQELTKCNLKNDVVLRFRKLPAHYGRDLLIDPLMGWLTCISLLRSKLTNAGSIELKENVSDHLFSLAFQTFGVARVCEAPHLRYLICLYTLAW